MCSRRVSVGARNPPGFVSAQEFRRGLSAGFTLEIDVSELLAAVVAYHKQACACNSSTDQGGGKRRGSAVGFTTAPATSRPHDIAGGLCSARAAGA
jgi:hypothetical protein